MFRLLWLAVWVAALHVSVLAGPPDTTKPTVDIRGSHNDESLKKHLPANGVIVSQKGWEQLAKAWGIPDPPKVDFSKEILIVCTTVGSGLNVKVHVDDQGDLKVTAISTLDLGPGFRYVIKSVSREGVKTVNGKELPKE
ncbi:MAG: hypothetical protein RMJ56_05765 [Gemmataceae bacterium]|nr:hypothetical protein [Gemmata sp.]MDW8197095.1 hypothetical protein [Gemmataceae bacterium]